MISVLAFSIYNAKKRVQVCTVSETVRMWTYAHQYWYIYEEGNVTEFQFYFL